MMNLAIKGHATRGSEVIKLLEMLGGTLIYNYTGRNTTRIYFVGDNKLISWDYMGDYMGHEKKYKIFTLEEFLEKFPYKVGDMIRVYDFESSVCINDMYWDGYEIQYKVFTDEDEWYTAAELDEINTPHHEIKDQESFNTPTYSHVCPKTHKEETIEDKPNLLQQLKDYFDNTPRDIVEKEWHEYNKYNEIGSKVNEYLEYINNIRQTKYPKTYEECCDLLYPHEKFQFHIISQPIKGHRGEILFDLQKLLICRDAYWEVAGKEMGLDKPWEPDWNELKVIKYTIQAQEGYTYTYYSCSRHKVLSFPTAEMRDVFYENFKELIEKCKELL